LTTTNTAELSEKGQWLKDLLPKNTEVMHIKRKPKYRKKLESTQIFLGNKSFNHCPFSLSSAVFVVVKSSEIFAFCKAVASTKDASIT
jgi:hypothetical protein